MKNKDYLKAKELGTIKTKRWENGISHHPMSKRIVEFMSDHDYYDYRDSMCIKIGGDGDNGEHLMYLMDPFFEMLDKEKEANKNFLITEIKKMINDINPEGITSYDMEMNSSIVYNSNYENHFSLIEQFNLDNVEVITYIHDTAVDEFMIDYEKLSNEIIEEIHKELIDYKKYLDKLKDEENAI